MEIPATVTAFVFEEDGAPVPTLRQHAQKQQKEKTRWLNTPNTYLRVNVADEVQRSMGSPRPKTTVRGTAGGRGAWPRLWLSLGLGSDSHGASHWAHAPGALSLFPHLCAGPGSWGAAPSGADRPSLPTAQHPGARGFCFLPPPPTGLLGRSRASSIWTVDASPGGGRDAAVSCVGSRSRPFSVSGSRTLTDTLALHLMFC